MRSREANQLAIIDDDPHVLAALTRLLRTDGYEIASFTRPVDALAFLIDEPVGVILTDQCMPQMEGVDLLDAVKAYQPDAIPIILSGYLDPPPDGVGQQRYLALSKPWDNDALRCAVAGAFARHCAIKNRH